MGITSGLGLLRTRRRIIRPYLKEKWDNIRLQRSKGRRKRLTSRFKKYVQRYNNNKSDDELQQQKSRINPMGIEIFDIDDDDDIETEEEDDDDASEVFNSVDAMIAKAGVLRTRIRLRQESLTDLERLTRDVKLEIKRMGWKKNTNLGYNVDEGYATKRTEFMYGQPSQPSITSTSSFGAAFTNNAGSTTISNSDSDVMNESNLATLNAKWKQQSGVEGKFDKAAAIQQQAAESSSQQRRNDQKDANKVNDDDEESETIMEELQLQLMESRSQKLQQSILLDRIRLQRLERRILCFETDDLSNIERKVGNTLSFLNDFDFLSSLFDDDANNPIRMIQRQSKKFVNTFGVSTSVLLRKLDRVQSKSGPNNRDYGSVTDFVVREGAAGVRIVGSLLSNPEQLSQLVDPSTPSLVPHVPAILARLDKLESHVAPILSRVLNNKQHLPAIEPYLDEVLERFDDIEPHLPWILDHIDTLAPYTGLLLKHIDELLLYAEVDEYEAAGSDGCSKGDNYAFAEQLLPYLEVYVSQLDLVGPHLPLLRPHLPLLLKHNRIKILSPHVGVLFAKGYKDLSGECYVILLSHAFWLLFCLLIDTLTLDLHTCILILTMMHMHTASANMDILLFYFGWALRIPFVPRLFFSLPGSPGMVSALANRLPKRLVRGRCCDVSCYVDGDYGEGWNELQK